MTPRPGTLYEPDTFGNLPSLCWCMVAVVDVPATEVRAGRTRACKRWRCQVLALDVEREAVG